VGSGRRTLSYAPQPRAPVSRSIRRVLTALSLATVALACFYLGRTSSSTAPSPSLPITQPLIALATPPAKDVNEVYRTDIVPLLDRFERRNNAAVERAIVVLRDRMARHRAGVSVFADEMMSWGTRFGVVGRYSTNVWHKLWREKNIPDRVAEYVHEKFYEQVLSEDDLKQDVAAVLAQFNEDMTASRNQLYVELTLPLSQIQLGSTHATTQTAGVDQLAQAMQRQAADIAKASADTGVIAGIVSAAGGWLATDAATSVAESVVTQILTTTATAMAAEGIEATSATAGGAAAGGGVGSFAGPAGTIVGIGVGLVAGCIVDWCLSSHFRAKITAQCNAFLDDVESGLRDGSAKVPGLKQALSNAARTLTEAQREAILQSLKQQQQP
jgi:hypothetical protein